MLTRLLARRLLAAVIAVIAVVSHLAGPGVDSPPGLKAGVGVSADNSSPAFVSRKAPQAELRNRLGVPHHLAPRGRASADDPLALCRLELLDRRSCSLADGMQPLPTLTVTPFQRGPPSNLLSA